jgi:pentatricopeptide repeat protein
MGRLLRRLWLILFPAAAAAVIWFLHLFSGTDLAITYIDWDSSVQILEDGSEQPFSADIYSNATELSGVYRFTGTIPEGLGNGSLLFETDGLSITLSLNGEMVWRSESARPEALLALAQGTVPLPEGASGTLEMTCEILDGSRAMFPPMLRFIPENLEVIQATALANQAAFPSGAAALALVLVFGLFLLGIWAGHPDFSLIPLLFALAGLILIQLIPSEGGFFLPADTVNLLGRQEIHLLAPLLLILYLAMNRRFWKYFGIACVWSAGAFVVCCLISAASGGHLADYVLNHLPLELQAGYFSGLIYWLSLWLALTAAAVSSLGILRAFSEQRAAERELKLRNRLITENLQSLQERMEEDAAARHELRHKLTALDCLCREKDLDRLREVLDQMIQEQDLRTAAVFTGNPAVNTILQYISGRAEKAGVRLDADIRIPERLALPETDLCSFLMNMLENALEAAAETASAEKRRISLRMQITGAYLAIRCENPYEGVLNRDKHGNLLTTKADRQAHGFGFRQMKAIAEKYHGLIDWQAADGQIFVLQAALRLQDQP